MKYRSRTDIIATILECARDGGRKTHIMSRAYISHTQVELHLELLEANGLLEYEPQDSSFKTTGKGLAFLQVYRYMNGIASQIKPLSRAKRK